MAQGGPGNFIQWQSAGIDLQGENSQSLTLPNITASDGGTYTCVVTNSAGNSSASVDVNIRPRFTSVSEDLQQRSGDSVTLTCEAESFPEATYVWRRVNGEGEGEDLSTSSNLDFPSVMFGDEGGYICIATSAGVEIQSDVVTLTSELISM